MCKVEVHEKSFNRAPGIILFIGACSFALGGCRTRLDERTLVTAARTETSCKVSSSSNVKADLLFMVDNSGSMDAMQAELRTRFPQFLEVFHELAQQGTLVDLHIGVVTSDYGAGKTGSGGGQCSPSPGGQQGRLQAIGQFAPAGCKAPLGANFIRYISAMQGDGPNNLPPGQTLDQTFSCMASVGARGCGYEHQLESVHAALTKSLPENEGFLRDDALLVVVFVTNEDDCSAPPETDLFDDNIARYGQRFSFRCTRYGILCGQPPVFAPYADSGGSLSMCQSAPDPMDQGPGRIFDISRYTDLFTKPKAQGGIKVDPSDILLAAIDAPAEPFSVVLADPHSGLHTGMPYTLCAKENETSNPPCVPVLQHSCQNMVDGAFFGDPAVRLNTVVATVPNHSIASICDTDYTPALQKVARLIISQSGPCCISDALPSDPRAPQDPTQFVADCDVEQVTLNEDGTKSSLTLPRCAEGVSAPCWSVLKKDQCAGLGPQNLGVTVVRPDGVVPPHTSVHASCLSRIDQKTTSTY